MACHDVRRLFRWEVEGSDKLKEGLVQWRRATSGANTCEDTDSYLSSL